MQFARRRVYVPSSYTSLGRTHLSLIAALSGINDTSDCLNECAGTRQNTLRRRHTHCCALKCISLSYMLRFVGYLFFMNARAGSATLVRGAYFMRSQKFQPATHSINIWASSRCKLHYFLNGVQFKGRALQHVATSSASSLIQNIGYGNVYNLSNNKLFIDDLLYLLLQ
jgi:hypothetical protein